MPLLEGHYGMLGSSIVMAQDMVLECTLVYMKVCQGQDRKIL